MSTHEKNWSNLNKSELLNILNDIDAERQFNRIETPEPQNDVQKNQKSSANKKKES